MLFRSSLWLPYSAFFLFFPMCSQLPVCSHTPWPCFPLDKSLSTQSGILQTQDSSVSAPVDPMLGEESSDSLENDRVSVSNSTPVFRPTHNTNLHVHFPSILELFRALWSKLECVLFFFFSKCVFLFIYLFIYGCVGSSFLCEGFL